MERAAARESLIDFTRYTYPRYVPDLLHYVIAGYLDAVVDRKITRLGIIAPPQHGKLCAHDTPVFTPTGWVRHGDLRPGDHVFGRDGRPVQVLAISEDGSADQEVTFTDGGVICCHSAHEWLIFDRGQHRPTETILETRAMAASDLWLGPRGRGGRGRYQVDANVCLECQTAELPLPPYVLGAWLGDGSTSKNCITHHPDDQPVIDKIERLGFARTSLCVHATTGIHTSYFRGLYRVLKQTGLLGHKHIPSTYLTSSVEQRLELLAGLVDTDGYTYQTNGRITFTNVDKSLIDDIARLVRSLGWRVSLVRFAPVKSSSGIQGKQTVYQLCFNPTTPIPVALTRKQTRLITPARRRRTITTIQPCSPRPGRCIRVEGGIYLVGETLIPTHNSELASVRFPAYHMGRRSDDPVILTSYGAELAQDKSRQARDLVETSDYRCLFPEVRVSPDKRATDNWRLHGRRGGIVAAGVGGPITGHGAALGIIDDPFENWEQAQSALERKKRWAWYQSTFRTRVWEGGAIVLVMTRWHPEDLVGQLVAQGGEPWVWVRLPAVAETQDERDKLNAELHLPEGLPDPLGREPGEPLSPSRYSQAELARIAAVTTSIMWAGLYQGAPRMAEGNRFKRHMFPIIDVVPGDVTRVVRYWDKAGTEGAGKRTAGVRMSRTRDGLYVVEDVVKGQWSAGPRENTIKQVAQTDRSRGLVHHWVEQEPGSGGKESADATVRNLGGHSIRVDKVTGAKEVRTEPYLAQAENGNVRLVRGEWNRDFIEEHLVWPNGAFLDQVDAASGCVAKLAGGGVLFD